MNALDVNIHAPLAPHRTVQERVESLLVVTVDEPIPENPHRFVRRDFDEAVSSLSSVVPQQAADPHCYVPRSVREERGKQRNNCSGYEAGTRARSSSLHTPPNLHTPQNLRKQVVPLIVHAEL